MIKLRSLETSTSQRLWQEKEELKLVYNSLSRKVNHLYNQEE